MAADDVIAFENEMGKQTTDATTINNYSATFNAIYGVACIDLLLNFIFVWQEEQLIRQNLLVSRIDFLLGATVIVSAGTQAGMAQKNNIKQWDVTLVGNLFNGLGSIIAPFNIAASPKRIATTIASDVGFGLGSAASNIALTSFI